MNFQISLSISAKEGREGGRKEGEKEKGRKERKKNAAEILAWLQRSVGQLGILPSYQHQVF